VELASKVTNDLNSATTLNRAIATDELSTDVMLLDTHGELTDWYTEADAAFVEDIGSVGGHNLFEPRGEAFDRLWAFTEEVHDVASLFSLTRRHNCP